METNLNEEMIMFPIPLRLYGDVIEFLARSQGKLDESEEIEKGAETWTKDDLVRLKSSINTTGRALMDLAVLAPEQWIPFNAVYKEAAQTSASARAGLAGLTRHIKRWYKRSRPPFAVKWGTDLGLGAQMYYRVSSEIADWWLESKPDNLAG